MAVKTKKSPEILAAMREEKTAIQSLRSLFSDRPQKTLAKQIRERNIGGQFGSDPIVRGFLAKCGYRGVLSIYSVIRRYDAKNKVTAPALATV